MEVGAGTFLLHFLFSSQDHRNPHSNADLAPGAVKEALRPQALAAQMS